MYRTTNAHTVNGHKYRSIEQLKPYNELGDEVWDWVGEEVLTPNCGWKNESDYCTKLCDNCAIAEELRDMIE